MGRISSLLLLLLVVVALLELLEALLLGGRLSPGGPAEALDLFRFLGFRFLV